MGGHRASPSKAQARVPWRLATRAAAASDAAGRPPAPSRSPPPARRWCTAGTTRPPGSGRCWSRAARSSARTRSAGRAPAGGGGASAAQRSWVAIGPCRACNFASHGAGSAPPAQRPPASPPQQAPRAHLQQRGLAHGARVVRLHVADGQLAARRHVHNRAHVERLACICGDGGQQRGCGSAAGWSGAGAVRDARQPAWPTHQPTGQRGLPASRAPAPRTHALTHGDGVAVGAARVVEGGGAWEQAHAAVLGRALRAHALRRQGNSGAG